MKAAFIFFILSISQVLIQAQARDLTFDPSLTLWYTQPASEREEALPAGRHMANEINKI